MEGGGRLGVAVGDGARLVADARALSVDDMSLAQPRDLFWELGHGAGAVPWEPRELVINRDYKRQLLITIPTSSSNG